MNDAVKAALIFSGIVAFLFLGWCVTAPDDALYDDRCVASETEWVAVPVVDGQGNTTLQLQPRENCTQYARFYCTDMQTKTTPIFHREYKSCQNYQR
jgi:hypothetical protein